MRASNANFDAAAADISKKPVYLAILEGIAAPDDKYITVEHPTINANAIMALPRTTSQTIRPEEGTSSFGTLGLSLQDRDQQITRLIRDNSMRGRKVTFKVGYRELAEADFLTLTIGFIQNIKASADFLSFEFDIRDPQIFGNETIFELKQTKLNGAVNATQVTFTVDSTADFPDPAVPRFPNLYFSIEEEIFRYTSIDSATQFTAIRAQKGTTAVAHDDNKEVNEFIVLEDGGINPITALLQILLSDDGFNDPTFDVLPDHWGLAIDPALIDIATFTSKRDELIPALTVEYRLAERETAKEFLTQEMFKVLGAYPFITGEGKLSIRFFERPLPLASLALLGEDKIRSMKSMDLNLDQMYNNLLFEYDWDAINEVYRTRTIKADPASIAKFGEQPLRVYTSKGLRTELNSDTFIDDRGGFILFRFANPPPIIRMECHFSELLIEVADHIRITELRLPQNIRSGQRGFGGATMEVVDQRVDLDRARVDLMLQFISFNREYALIGPPDPDNPGPSLITGATVLLDFPDDSELNHTTYAWLGDATAAFGGAPGSAARLDQPAGADLTDPTLTSGQQEGDLLG